MLDMEVFIDKVVAFLDLDLKSVIQTDETLPERQEINSSEQPSVLSHYGIFHFEHIAGTFGS
jgi:hypothetical protein